MKNVQAMTDKTAVGLSILCVIHCLAIPVVAVLLPTTIAVTLQDEIFHLLLLIAILPISAYALTMGCKKHKRYHLLLIGGTGLLILSFAALFGHDLVGHNGEKVLTVIGSVMLALGHVWNFRLCQRQDSCRQYTELHESRT